MSKQMIPHFQVHGRTSTFKEVWKEMTVTVSVNPPPPKQYNIDDM